MSKDKTVIKIKEQCKRHNRDNTNYLGWIEIAEQRRKKGEKQTQCKVCGRWYFPDEF